MLDQESETGRYISALAVNVPELVNPETMYTFPYVVKPAASSRLRFIRVMVRHESPMESYFWLMPSKEPAVEAPPAAIKVPGDTG